jgi:hypothetical protein
LAQLRGGEQQRDGLLADDLAQRRVVQCRRSAGARVDAYVSLGVIASAIVAAIGLRIADPLIGLAITVVILRIIWQPWATVRGHEHTRSASAARTRGRLRPSGRAPAARR